MTSPPACRQKVGPIESKAGGGVIVKIAIYTFWANLSLMPCLYAEEAQENHYKKGIQSYLQEDYENSIAYLKKAIELDQEGAKAGKLLPKVYKEAIRYRYRQNQLDQARHLVNEALLMFPSDDDLQAAFKTLNAAALASKKPSRPKQEKKSKSDPKPSASETPPLPKETAKEESTLKPITTSTVSESKTESKRFVFHWDQSSPWPYALVLGLVFIILTFYGILGSIKKRVEDAMCRNQQILLEKMESLKTFLGEKENEKPRLLRALEIFEADDQKKETKLSMPILLKGEVAATQMLTESANSISQTSSDSKPKVDDSATLSFSDTTFPVAMHESVIQRVEHSLVLETELEPVPTLETIVQLPPSKPREILGVSKSNEIFSPSGSFKDWEREKVDEMRKIEAMRIKAALQARRNLVTPTTSKKSERIHAHYQKKEIIETLIKITPDDRIESQKRISNQALSLYEAFPHEALKFLNKLAKDQEPIIRATIIPALAEIRDPAAIEILLKLAKDDNTEVKREALKSLKMLQLGKPDAPRPLAEGNLKRIQEVLKEEIAKADWVF